MGKGHFMNYFKCQMAADSTQPSRTLLYVANPFQGFYVFSLHKFKLHSDNNVNSINFSPTGAFHEIDFCRWLCEQTYMFGFLCFFGCIHTRNLLSHNIKWAGSSSKNSQIVRSSEQMSAASGSKWLSNGLKSNCSM